MPSSHRNASPLERLFTGNLSAALETGNMLKPFEGVCEMGVLDTYYNAITRQILTEIELISTLLSHQGLKGAHNELVLRDLLVRFLPRRYGVGSGIVIDSQGHSSRQCDMIIYDNFEHPQLTQQRSAVMMRLNLCTQRWKSRRPLDCRMLRILRRAVVR
jgi:hypothetical protein